VKGLPEIGTHAYLPGNPICRFPFAGMQVSFEKFTRCAAGTFVIRKPKTAKNVQIKKNNKISNTSNDTMHVSMRKGETVQLIFEV
jgi:hypothetical protein